jgi:hypothetical protein
MYIGWAVIRKVTTLVYKAKGSPLYMSKLEIRRGAFAPS